MSKRSRSAAGLSTLDAAIPATPPPPDVPDNAEKTTIAELCAQVEKGCQACLATCAAVDKLPKTDLHAQHAHIFPAEESADVELLVTPVISFDLCLATWYPGRSEQYKHVDDAFHLHLNFSVPGFSFWKHMIAGMRKSSVEYASFGDNPRSRRNLEALLHNITVLEGHLNALLSKLTSDSAKVELWKSDAHKSAAKAEFVALMKAWSLKYGIAAVGTSECITVKVRFGALDTVYNVKPTTLTRTFFQTVANVLGSSPIALTFHRGGVRMDSGKTLEDNHVMDGSVIDCCVSAFGD